MTPKRKRLAFDAIGYWSEIKLDIVKDYAKEYSKIFSAPKQAKFHHVYIDAFAGAGVHVSKSTGKPVPGSPLNALLIEPPFRECHLIDIDRAKLGSLKQLVGERSDVHLYEGDCNDILLRKVFPRAKYEDYRSALCLLDPYGLHLLWKVIETAGRMKSIDMFLNFPIADMNRNVIWRNPDGVDPDDIARMNAFWGDESWRTVAYTKTHDLFGEVEEKADHEAIIGAFAERLKKVAGFGYLPTPIPMRNSRRAIVYYLFFAAQKKVAADIVEHIFNKYKNRMA